MSSEATETSSSGDKTSQDVLGKDLNGKVSQASQNKHSFVKNKTHPEKKDITLPYMEPEWSSSPPPNYWFEVIKGGKVISEVHLNTPYITFGRLETCNVIFEHPSVSRYHSVLQYCPGDEARIKGFYIYDLGSTHGTFLNKTRITAKVYYKLEVGYILTFGGSTRLYIFQGPEEDVKEDQESKKKKGKEEAEICDWGMGEDADEEEDLTVNPFALPTASEELHLDDPKKTLRGWFEREGYELEYDVEEKGFRTFVCRVELPIDTPTGETSVTAEASVTGKKKEAVLACAMEACRILDRHGVLRQARHENRKRRRKNWEDEDFYDSEDDTFLDRTGAVEKKREIRKKMSRKCAFVETFESLTSKLESVNAEISEIEGKIQTSATNPDSQSDDEKDSLESYMSQIEGPSGTVIDKVTKSQLKLKLSELLKEKNQVEKLLDIARPAALPPVSKSFGIIGKRPTKKFQLPTVAKPQEIKISKSLGSDEEEEEEDSESDNDSAESKTKPSAQEIVQNNFEPTKSELTVSEPCVKDYNKSMDTASKKIFPKPSVSNLTSKQGEISEKTADVKNKPAVKVDVYNTSGSDYSMWVPPDNQTGDGTTHLNAKYGY